MLVATLSAESCITINLLHVSSDACTLKRICCAENQWHWTEIESGGRGKSVDPLEIRTADMQQELLIEVRSGQGVVAAGALSASELWKVPALIHIARLRHQRPASRARPAV